MRPVPGPPLKVWIALVPSAWDIGVLLFFLFEVINLWRWTISCCRNSPGRLGVNLGIQVQTKDWDCLVRVPFSWAQS